MIDTNSPESFGPTPSGPRPVGVPRPTHLKPIAPIRKQSAPLPSRTVSKIPTPPPAPRRPVVKRPKASPPPLPETILLTDADLIDDEYVGRAGRAPQPTAVDVEIDCFSRTEPPPVSRPRRTRALLALVTSLVLVAATGALCVGRPIALQALRLLDNAGLGAAHAPAMLTVAALSTPSPAVVPQKSADAAPASSATSAAPRAKLSAHAKRSDPTLARHKKPVKSARPQRVPNVNGAFGAAGHQPTFASQG